MGRGAISQLDIGGRRGLPNICAPTLSGAFSLPINRQDYLELVDASGRIVREGKRGSIPENAPPLLAPLGVDPGAWFNTVTGQQPRQGRFLGSPHQLQQVVEQRGWHWVWGITASRRLYRYAND